VPEDRLTGKGRTISLRFMVIPATGPGKPSVAAIRASRQTPRPEGTRIASSATFVQRRDKVYDPAIRPRPEWSPQFFSGVEMVQQGSLELLHDPVAEKLLGSTIPARRDYLATWMLTGSSCVKATG